MMGNFVLIGVKETGKKPTLIAKPAPKLQLKKRVQPKKRGKKK